jgi:hypothetical protein
MMSRPSGRWLNLNRLSPRRQKSVGGLSAASPTHAAESTDGPFAVRSTRGRTTAGPGQQLIGEIPGSQLFIILMVSIRSRPTEKTAR